MRLIFLLGLVLVTLAMANGTEEDAVFPVLTQKKPVRVTRLVPIGQNSESLGYLNQMACDKSNRSFLAVGDESKFISLDENWRVVGSYGGRGEGPGEFAGQVLGIHAGAGIVIATDEANRVSFFDENGRIIDNFSLDFQPSAKFAVDEETTIWFNHPFGRHLLNGYDLYGRKKAGIGEVVKFKSASHAHFNNQGMVFAGLNQKLVFAYSFKPTIVVYSQTGKILRKYDFGAYKGIRARLGFIEDREKTQPAAQGNRISLLFQDGCLDRDRLFLLYWDDLPAARRILEIDLNKTADPIVGDYLLNHVGGEVPFQGVSMSVTGDRVQVYDGTVDLLYLFSLKKA